MRGWSLYHKYPFRGGSQNGSPLNAIGTILYCVCIGSERYPIFHACSEEYDMIPRTPMMIQSRKGGRVTRFAVKIDVQKYKIGAPP